MATSITQLDRDAAQEQVHEIVRQLLAELGSRHAFDAVRPAAHLERDLGLGSLERVELVERLEQFFSVRLPDEAAAQVNTLEDLGDALARAAANGGNGTAAPEMFSAGMRHVRRHADASADGDELAAQLERAETLTEVLERHARAHPDRPQIFLREDPASGAQQPEPHQITYGELLSKSRAIAASLVERGLAPGQTVAMMLPTCREFFFTFYGTLLAGGVPVPIYPPFRADRIEEYAARQSAILKNAEARLLVTFRQAETVAKMLKPRVPSLIGVVNAEKLVDSAQTGMSAPRYHPRGSDIAFIQYTSGSTGEPKGVVLTHANLLANMRAIKEALDIRQTSVAVSWLPLYHDMGLIGAWLTILYSGVPVAVMSPMAFLTRPERWLWAIHHHRGTITAAPNFAYELCVRKIADKDIEGLDLSSWRLALNGAEPVHPETLERFAERFGPYGFRAESMLPVYGLAEASLAVTVPPLDRLPRVDRVNRETFQREGRAVPIAVECRGEPVARPELQIEEERATQRVAPTDVLSFVSAGVAVPRHEVRIADEHGNEAPERVEGQLWFRGPSTTSGYYRNPEATKRILRAHGWVDSGDRAYRAGGEIFITGRVKDIIIKAGRNLYPHEVEEIAGGVAGVRRGCVVAFGAKDEHSGTERLVVVAETRDRALSADKKNEIAAEMRAGISDSLGLPPDVIELVPAGSIPKTSSGKLRRAETKKLFTEGALGKGKPPVWMQVAKLGAATGAHTARSGLWRAFELIYGVYAALAFAVFIVPTWLAAYFAPSKRAACRVTQIGTRMYFGMIGCRLDVRGREHLESGGPFVLVSNHTSFFDVVMFLAILKIPYHFVSKMEVGSWPFIGTFIRKREDFTFNRDDRAARLAQATAIDQCLRDGESVLVFPEGTFTPHEGLRAFQLGAFKSAAVTGRPVLPIGIRGMRNVFRDEARLPKPGSVTITICPPIFPRGNHWQEILRLRDETRAAVGEHCGEPVL